MKERENQQISGLSFSKCHYHVLTVSCVTLSDCLISVEIVQCRNMDQAFV